MHERKASIVIFARREHQDPAWTAPAEIGAMMPPAHVGD
jgi:hypothetical protein